MSVVPMKLLTIAGPLERFDDVVRACVIDQEFHPENALQLMRSVKGLRPLELENPYSALLHRSVEVADEAGIPLAYAPFDPASPLEDFASYFDSLSGRIAALHRRREELEHKADEARSMVDQLQNLDAVLVPVGGFYTVGPKEAKEIVDALQARVVIPMHYRSDAFGFDVLAPVEDFLELDSHWMRYETDTLEIHENMRHSVAVLTYGG